jgi:hypothetical protein
MEQAMSQPKQILQVSTKDVDEDSECTREAAHGLDRVTTFSGRKRHMSSPILPIEDYSATSQDESSATSTTEDIAAFVSGLAEEQIPLPVAARRGGPPLEVLAQIAGAGRIHARMREKGHHLRFLADASGGRTRIELHDHEGNLLRSLSTVEAFELAAGQALA